MDEILEAEEQISNNEKKKKLRKRMMKSKGKVVDPDLEGDPKYLDSSSESCSATDEGGEVSPNLLLMSEFYDCSFSQLADSLPLKTISVGQKQTSKAAGSSPHIQKSVNARLISA